MLKQNCQKVSLKCVNTNLNARIPHTCFISLIILEGFLGKAGGGGGREGGHSKVTFSWLLNILQL